MHQQHCLGYPGQEATAPGWMSLLPWPPPSVPPFHNVIFFLILYPHLCPPLPLSTLKCWCWLRHPSLALCLLSTLCLPISTLASSLYLSLDDCRCHMMTPDVHHSFKFICPPYLTVQMDKTHQFLFSLLDPYHPSTFPPFTPASVRQGLPTFPQSFLLS